MLKKILIAITAFSLVSPYFVAYAEEETTEYVSPFQNPYLDGWTLREISEQNKIDNLQEIAQVVSPATITEYCNNLIRGFYSQYIVGSAESLVGFTEYLVQNGIYDAIELVDGFFVLTDPDFILNLARQYFEDNAYVDIPPSTTPEHFYKISNYRSNADGLKTQQNYPQWFINNASYDQTSPQVFDTTYICSYMHNGYATGLLVNRNLKLFNTIMCYVNNGRGALDTNNSISYSTGSYFTLSTYYAPSGYVFPNLQSALNAFFGFVPSDGGQEFTGDLYFNENPSDPLPIPVRNVFYTDYEKNIDDKYHKLISTSPTENDFLEPTPKEYTTNYPKPVAYYVPRGDEIEDPSVSEFDFVAPEINNSLFGELVIPDFFVMIISLLCIFLVIRCIM